MPDDWPAFGAALARTVRDLDERSFLIVSLPGSNVYVQFASGVGEVAAEAVGEDVVAASQRYSVDQVGLMREAGWTPPAVAPPGNTNWTKTLTWPATTAQYRALADACVLALQLRGVSSPTELSYRAWREPERPAPGVTVYPGDLDDGDPQLELPQLGLVRTA